jgi:phospholipid/cholesterol/gamma-HCH transport system substrate-binding protein
MAESSKRTQVTAGIFVFCGLAMLGGLILKFGPLQHLMRKPYQVYAEFSDAQNLIEGAPVRRAGKSIGKVASPPKLMDGLKGVQVTLDIYPEYKIPAGSKLKITTLGFLGDSAVDVVLPEQMTSEVVAAGAVMTGDTSPDLTSAATRVSDEAVVVLKDIRTSLAEINKTIGKINNGLLSDTNLKNIENSIAALQHTLDRVDKEVMTEENVAAIRDSLAILKQTMQTGSSAMAKADSALAKVDKAVDQLGPGLKGFAEATAALKSTGTVLESLLREIRSGRGILHAVINDPLLRDNMERLVANLRRHGLLWYKDKAPSALPPEPVPPPPASTKRKR